MPRRGTAFDAQSGDAGDVSTPVTSAAKPATLPDAMSINTDTSPRRTNVVTRSMARAGATATAVVAEKAVTVKVGAKVADSILAKTAAAAATTAAGPALQAKLGLNNIDMKRESDSASMSMSLGPFPSLPGRQQGGASKALAYGSSPELCGRARNSNSESMSKCSGSSPGLPPVPGAPRPDNFHTPLQEPILPTDEIPADPDLDEQTVARERLRTRETMIELDEDDILDAFPLLSGGRQHVSPHAEEDSWTSMKREFELDESVQLRDIPLFNSCESPPFLPRALCDLRLPAIPELSEEPKGYSVVPFTQELAPRGFNIEDYMAKMDEKGRYKSFVNFPGPLTEPFMVAGLLRDSVEASSVPRNNGTIPDIVINLPDAVVDGSRMSGGLRPSSDLPLPDDYDPVRSIIGRSPDGIAGEFMMSGGLGPPSSSSFYDDDEPLVGPDLYSSSSDRGEDSLMSGAPGQSRAELMSSPLPHPDEPIPSIERSPSNASSTTLRYGAYPRAIQPVKLAKLPDHPYGFPVMSKGYGIEHRYASTEQWEHSSLDPYQEQDDVKNPCHYQLPDMEKLVRWEIAQMRQDWQEILNVGRMNCKERAMCGKLGEGRCTTPDRDLLPPRTDGRRRGFKPLLMDFSEWNTKFLDDPYGICSKYRKERLSQAREAQTEPERERLSLKSRDSKTHPALQGPDGMSEAQRDAQFSVATNETIGPNGVLKDWSTSGTPPPLPSNEYDGAKHRTLMESIDAIHSSFNLHRIIAFDLDYVIHDHLYDTTVVLFAILPELIQDYSDFAKGVNDSKGNLTSIAGAAAAAQIQDYCEEMPGPSKYLLRIGWLRQNLDDEGNSHKEKGLWYRPEEERLFRTFETFESNVGNSEFFAQARQKFRDAEQTHRAERKGLKEFLAALGRAGKEVVIITHGDENEACNTVERLGLSDLVRDVVAEGAYEDIEHARHNGVGIDLFGKAVRQIKHSFDALASDVLYIGYDKERHIMPAHAAGMDVMIWDDGSRKYTFPFMVEKVHSFTEMHEIFETGNLGSWIDGESPEVDAMLVEEEMDREWRKSAGLGWREPTPVGFRRQKGKGKEMREAEERYGRAQAPRGRRRVRFEDDVDGCGNGSARTEESLVGERDDRALLHGSSDVGSGSACGTEESWEDMVRRAAEEAKRGWMREML